MKDDVLLLTPQLPYPPQQGTSLRNYHIICGLAQRHEVSLLSFVEASQSTAAADIAPLLDKVVRLETVPVPPRSPRQRLWQLLTTRQPDMAHRLWSEPFAVTLRQMLAERPFAIVQIEGIELAPYMAIVHQVSPASQIVFDNHNAETELQRRNFLTDIRRPRRWLAAGYSWVQVRRLRRFERWACQTADAVTAVSETDAAHLQELVKSEKLKVKSDKSSVRNSQFTIHNSQFTIAVIPNSIDTSQYARGETRQVLDDGMAKELIEKPDGFYAYDLIFSGKMDYRPNIDAVLWFAEAVWPLIVAQRPLTTWAIVGQKPHARLDSLRGQRGITLTGWVESMLPYLHGAKVAIMPFRIGSGTRLKIIEAMAAGMAIVSTAVGAEGFPVQPGQELLLCDEAEEMATAVLDLLENAERRQALGAAAQQFAQQYDWQQIVPRFESVYQAVLRNGTQIGAD